jgi:hypothetical protein
MNGGEGNRSCLSVAGHCDMSANERPTICTWSSVGC